MKSSSCEAGRCYLLKDADHGCGRADVQSEWCGQHILVLQAAGVKLGPELHLQQPVVLLTELVLCHAALKLKTMFSGNTDEEMNTEGKIATPYLIFHCDRDLFLQLLPRQVRISLCASFVDLDKRNQIF